LWWYQIKYSVPRDGTIFFLRFFLDLGRTSQNFKLLIGGTKKFDSSKLLKGLYI
jgi:hypothetical protein